MCAKCCGERAATSQLPCARGFTEASRTLRSHCALQGVCRAGDAPGQCCSGRRKGAVVRPMLSWHLLAAYNRAQQCCAVGERAAGAPAALLSSHRSLLALPLAVLPAGPRIYISLLGAKQGAAAQAAWLRKINKLFNKAFYPLYILSLIKILHRQKVQKLV